MQRTNGKADFSTPRVELFATTRTKCSTRGEVYSMAVDNYGKHFQNHGARKVVASLTGIGYKRLSAAIEDERHLWDFEVDALFRICLFPIGYSMLQQINFQANNMTPLVGKVSA